MNLFKKKKIGDKVDVLMKNSGRHKIMVIDVVRNITGMGIDDATHFVAKTPGVVKYGVPIEEAESIKSKLEAVGATVLLRTTSAENTRRRTTSAGNTRR